MGFNEIRSRVIFSIRSFSRWVGSCFLILGLVVFFFLLYRYLPSVFSFLLSYLLSSSPIVVCTAVLLHVLFSFGDPNVHKDKRKEKVKDDNSVESPPSLGVRRRDITDKTKSSVYGIPQHWESGPSQPSIASFDGSYAVSECSMASNDGSFEMEDETGRLEDGIQPLEWTEDDEKNLMDLGTSELERNRRLENLIARRRATRLSRLAAEKDSIDFDNNEFFPIPAITTKRNDPPLDISYNPIDASELPPIPCSAPPVLLSTRNPFDIPYDPLEEKPNLMEDSFQEEFMLVSQKDVQFCRHESFSLGPSFMGEPKKDIHDSKLTPFVVTEQITSESVLGGGYPSCSKGMNHESTDYVVSSAPEAEPLSFSVADLDDQEKFIEQDLSQGGKMLSLNCFVPESVEQESQASNEVVNSNSECIDQEENREVQIVDIPGVDKEVTHEMDSESTTSDSGEVYMKPEVPRKYEGLSSSPLKEKDGGAESEKTFDNNKDEGLKNPSCHIPDGTDNNQIEEPYCDSSPSAIDKKAIKENLFYVDKGVILTTASSIASDLQVEVSQAGSPPAPLDRTFSQTDGYILVHSEGSTKEELSSGSELPYDASSYPSDEGNEPRSNQVTRCSELETRRSSGDIDNEAALHVMPETTVVEQVSSNSSWDSVAVEHVSINTSLSSSPPPVPSATSDPNVLLDKKEEADYVACNDSDASSHEASIHPFKEEMCSGNEGQHGASSHPGGDGNESRANIIMQISEVESTKAGLSGGSEDTTTLNLASEPMVVEQVSSHSLPELEEGDSAACNGSDALSHEALTYPFEVEVSSGNEGPYGASSHHGGDENKLRASRIIQSSEVETTKAGLSGSNEDPSALNLVSERMVVEQVSPYSLPELEGGDSVACNDSDALPLETLTYPFKEKVNSGNEGPYGASFHPGGDENDSRASRIIQISEVETTKAGLSGDNEDLAALNLVSEPMVVERVSSHSLPELERGDSGACNNSDALSHEALTYPFEGEVSSGNEGPYGASSHPVGDENDSRASRIIHISEVETTNAGLSGDSEDPATLNLVSEPMVVEKVSSHSLPELEGGDFVASNNSDALSHEALAYTFEGEVSSGNEGPFGASSHPGGDENESRANRIIQSSEVETTEAGLSGGIKDPAALNLVPEPMVVEQVSSHSLPELKGGDSVAYNDSDALSHEALAYPFEGVVSSGNEGPYGASSHPGGDENESRANRIIQSSEVETTKAGLSGGSEDSAALNLVPEPMVVEQVSSHSLPELEGGDSMACNDSDALLHEALTYPFEGEVSSGNEGPYDASSHHGGDENELRAVRIIQSSEVETTEAGLSGGSEDPAALNLASEPMVAEQVSSHSLPELEGGDSVACIDLDALSLKALTCPFEEKVSSGNEGPYGASSHPGGDENESRANKIIQSNEAEATEAGLSRGSDDLAAQHLVPEPMVVEQVSSHSLPESVAVEKAPTNTFSSPYPSTDQVPLHTSDPMIPVGEEKEKLVPLMQEPIVQPPQEVHEEPQTLFLMEKPSLNGEEPQEKSTILVNTTEETTIIPSRKESAVFQDETEDKEKSKPSEVHEA